MNDHHQEQDPQDHHQQQTIDEAIQTSESPIESDVTIKSLPTGITITTTSTPTLQSASPSSPSSNHAQHNQSTSSPSPSPSPSTSPSQSPSPPLRQRSPVLGSPLFTLIPEQSLLMTSDDPVKEDPLTARLTDLKIRGSRLPGDNGSSPSIVPDWFNRELFDLGRSVGRNHFSSVLFGHLSGLTMVVHIPSILATLLATGKSRTLGDIFERYLGTLSHVITWYEGDIWNQNDPAHKSLITVRRMHSNVASRMNPPRPGNHNHHHQSSFPHHQPNNSDNHSYSSQQTPATNDRQIYLSQYDMALTQFGFIGMIILHPKQVGFPDNSQDLVGLIHFWRCVGYLLGLDDRFNILDENDLPGTRALCARLLESEFKPAINRYPTNQASQMSTAIIQAIKAVIPVLSTRGFTKYLYKMNTLESPVPLDGTAARVGYQGIKVIMRNFLPRPLITPAINALLKKSIQRAQRKSDLIKSRLTNKDDLILEETCFTDV